MKAMTYDDCVKHILDVEATGRITVNRLLALTRRKRCHCCQEIQGFDEYWVDRSTEDLRSTTCRTCCKRNRILLSGCQTAPQCICSEAIRQDKAAHHAEYVRGVVDGQKRCGR
jgi:hypothetical protein